MKIYRSIFANISKLGAALIFLGTSILSCSKNDSTTPVPGLPKLNQNDSLALLDVYERMGGRYWSKQYQWNTDTPVSKWRGVKVAKEGNEYRVVELWFSNLSEIEGKISPKIGDLASLKVLGLTGRRLTGVIPSEIGQLKDLQLLRIYTTGLSGPLPNEIGNLKQLNSLEIDENPGLTGGLPKELGNLEKLNYLYVGNSENIAGTLHPEFGNLKNLEKFYLRNIGLTGNLPKELGKLQKLKELSFVVNKISGVIPKELAALNNCDVNLASNQLNGDIPEELGSSSSYFVLSKNNLKGVIPQSLLNKYINRNDLSSICPQNVGYGFSNCQLNISK
ncbi:hypothetical protein [Sphingobacterium sp.]|uniref:leucine-rich repeat domain-containing protein n=1 Tax=Sphingobacterium sp. TaxID=341027 RepID=UPI0031DAE188